MTVKMTVFHSLTESQSANSESIPYYNYPEDFVTYRQEKYIDTGKLSIRILSSEEIANTVYPNALEAIELTFINIDAKKEYGNDPIIQEPLTYRNNQYKDSGITTIVMIEKFLTF
jgi:hypothetical protein